MSHSDPQSHPSSPQTDAQEAASPPFTDNADGHHSRSSETGDWETVQAPNTVNVEAIPQAASAPPPEPSLDSGEMLRLIQDLNQCNDALLARVAELEDALERSDTALQKEVDRSQQSQHVSSSEAQSRLVQQQQQVAQLLSELDIANDALRRTTIHNETLQAELGASQQRVAQLERECTLLQQRFGEKNSALQLAESSCRDLRSRLQRQQRYTLQFKAALEKCLNMSSGRSDMATALTEEADGPAVHPLTMPKNQQIQPWTAAKGSVPSPTGLDNMLRGLRSDASDLPAQSAHSPAAPPAAGLSPALSQSPDAGSDPEAEDRLWEDLERVVESSAGAPGMPQSESGAQPLASPEPAPSFTEPSPWGAPLPSVPSPSADQAAPAEPAAPVAQFPVADESPRATPGPAPVPAAAVAQEPVRPGSHPGLVMPPTMKAQPTTGGSPSPVVYPLRSSKKLNSIAAVQLPSFPKPRRRSS